MKTLIKNAKTILPDFSGYKAADVLIENGRISAVGGELTGDTVIDAKDKYLLPGLIDIHTHGSVMGNYASNDDFDVALEYCARAGVTSVVATIGVNPLDTLISYMKNVITRTKRTPVGSNIVGIHLEGPFLSSEKKGSMHTPAIEATVENFNKLIDAGEGLVKIMTIAPESENVLDIISEGKKRGIRMSIGHPMATYEQAM